MILEVIKDHLNGDDWEKLIVTCCRSTYKEYDFTEVPANYKGDCGIEGYTNNGIVIQCYCPNDSNLSNDDLYEKQRIKVTNDINKIINLENAKRLEKIGVTNVEKWVFIVPEYRDKRILEHLTEKTKSVSTHKQQSPHEYPYISDKFKCVIKVADDFINEIIDLFNANAMGKKIDLPLLRNYDANWEHIDSEKVDNVKRKLNSINPNLSKKHDLWNKMIDNHMTLYAQGLKFMDGIGATFPDLRAQVLEIKNLYKLEVESKSAMNPNHTLNNQIFTELQKEFTEHLNLNFPGLSPNTIMSLTQSTTAEWLADCPLEFIGEINE